MNRISNESKHYTCGYEGCGKIFRVKGNLMFHLRYHIAEKPY